jgi:membrane protease YdiL (CAAX protease family)
MREKLRRHRIACYLVITFAVTWCSWLGLAARGQIVTEQFSAMYLLGLLGPAIGAVATTAVLDGRGGLQALRARMLRARVGLRWWGVALGLPRAIAAAHYVVVVAYSVFLLAPIALPTSSAFGQFVGYPVTNALVLALLVIAINGFGEETGWRGFLLPTLQRRHSAISASLVVAVIWSTWHLPAFLINANYRGLSPAVLPMFFAGILCGSLFLTWLYNRGNQSIALVATWHGVFNMLTGTVAARGSLAAVETTAVMIIAIALTARELRAVQRERHGRPARHVLAPGSAAPRA